MSRAVLSIGSNVGDRTAMLRIAVEAFRPWLQAVSPVYRTPPWGPVEQGDYLNAVLLAEDAGASPSNWLERAHDAEVSARRTREVRWGPRTLDVDVIDVDGMVSTDPVLMLPHPRAAQRAFVLVPWAAVDPTALLGGRPLGTWLDALPAADVAAVHRVDEVLT